MNRYITKAEAAMRNVRHHRLHGNTRKAKYWNKACLKYCFKGLKLIQFQARTKTGVWSNERLSMNRELFAGNKFTSGCGEL